MTICLMRWIELCMMLCALSRGPWNPIRWALPIAYYVFLSTFEICFSLKLCTLSVFWSICNLMHCWELDFEMPVIMMSWPPVLFCQVLPAYFWLCIDDQGLFIFQYPFRERVIAISSLCGPSSFVGRFPDLKSPPIPLCMLAWFTDWSTRKREVHGKICTLPIYPF